MKSVYIAGYIFYIQQWIVYVAIAIIMCRVWSRARLTRRADFLPWIAPITISNIAVALLMTIVILHGVMRIHNDVAYSYFYYIYEGITAAIGLYGVNRIWGVLRASGLYQGKLPAQNLSAEAADVWPPPPNITTTGDKE